MCTVFLVAEKWRAVACELDADLVWSAGMQVDFEQAEVVFCHHCLVIENGFFGFRMVGVHAEDLILLSVFIKVVRKSARVSAGFAMDDGKISAIDRASAQHVGHARGGFGCFGENHCPTNGSVQAVQEAEVYVAGFLVPVFNVMFQHCKEIKIPAGVGLNRDVDRLFDKKKMIVLEQYRNFQWC